MTRFLGEKLWRELARVSGGAETKVVAVPYYASSAKIRCGTGDVLIVDATDQAIAGGQTSAAVLIEASKRGALVYSHSNLHAKIVLTKNAAIVSSANLSDRSPRLREAGALFTGAAALRQIVRYTDALRAEATELQRSDLERLATIPVSPRARATEPSLLEALADDMPVLRKLTFGVSGGTPDLHDARVKTSVHSRGWKYPKGATWFESEDRAGVLSGIERLCTGHPLVHFSVSFDNDCCIKRFLTLDSVARPFLYALQVDGYVVSVFGARISTAVDLRRDGPDVVRALTAGLARASRTVKRRISNDEGVIAVDDIRHLYKLSHEAA